MLISLFCNENVPYGRINGIFWGNSDGIETIVEVLPDNKAVTVAMRCSDQNTMLAFLQLRSCVIQKVFAAVSDFCAKVKTIEYFIDPSEILSYPVNITTLYSMKEITTLIVRRPAESLFVVSEFGKSLPLKELLIFEPYALLQQEVIVKLFSSNDTNSEQVSDYALAHLVETLLNQESMVTFAKLLKNTTTTPPTSAQLFQILKTWRNSSGGTYQCLRQMLDQYSVYGGRNILVSETLYIHNII